jgi:predicted CoA-substrate-specific enzyme activase
MSVYVGIDVGTVSVKVALLVEGDSRDVLLDASRGTDLFPGSPMRLTSQGEAPVDVLLSRYHRIKGSPVSGSCQILERLLEVAPAEHIKGVRVCGSGCDQVGDLLGANSDNEFRALATGVGALYPRVCTVFEIGGHSSKYIALERCEKTGETGIANYESSGDCAAGTGSFLDQQAARLRYDVEEIGDIVAGTGRSAKIAGRCSVFAKSDMIHAQQQGYTPAEVLRGLCEAIARNFKSSIVKGKKVGKPVVFVGGLAQNPAVVSAMRSVFRMNEDDLIVPGQPAWMAAIGSALAERRAADPSGALDLRRLRRHDSTARVGVETSPPLSLCKAVFLGDRTRPRSPIGENETVAAYLGIDIGSISTKLALVDESGDMLKAVYTRTDGRPIEVVDRCLREIEAELGDQIRIKGVGTTGSGRELIGELVGADAIKDEITAHKTGAEFVGRTMLDMRPDTIFDIGGQDSKYISLENGVVVDFAMNEACAAGTGSFLEERAEELGISINEEFAELALSSRAPIKLGERCTVFMQQDVVSHQQGGAKKADLAAGLAYSIAYNYLNRVVRGRKIGDVIFFQGGTAYNRAIASAFAEVLGREVIVPPYNGVMGAVGSALLAREKRAGAVDRSKFRGYSLAEVDYSLREFDCKACSNFCSMQEFTVEGQKTYWGDQCSDKFRRKQTGPRKPAVEDLLALRRELLFSGYNPEVKGKARVGMPRGMYVHEQFPFWNTFFRELGYTVVLSDETNSRIVRAGVEASVAEPCLPIQAYHGHVRDLLDKGVDMLFIPNVINAETPHGDTNSFYCLWGQTLPFVVGSAAAFSDARSRIIAPLLRFREGPSGIARSLASSLKPLGERKRDVVRALGSAYLAQEDFNQSMLAAGRRTLQSMNDRGELGIVLVGRAYNVHDRGMILDIGGKLRDYYGVNVIPMDCLPVDDVDITDVNPNMFWNYGRKILAAARIVGRSSNLHIIYLTNFKCGPDSYIKHFVSKASGRPFLTLQFDGHGNDAGYLTRCEAYLDSKGFLRSDSQSAPPGTTRQEACGKLTALELAADD